MVMIEDCQPNWIGIGVVKGGTTSLYQALLQHPKICMPESKETHFFCSTDYEKGLEYYRTKFLANARRGASVGEISPKYFIHRDVPGRIKENLGPDLRFFVILRNPIHRAWSHWCHSYERFRLFPWRPTEDLEFYDALLAEPKRLAEPDEYSFTHHYWNAYLHTGKYMTHLSNWINVFGKDAIQVILFDDLIARPQRTLNSLCEHIGVARIQLEDPFPKTNSYAKGEVPANARDFLTDNLSSEVRDLGNFLSRDLSHWLQP